MHVKIVKRFKYNEDLNKLPHALQRFFVTGLAQNDNPFAKPTKIDQNDMSSLKQPNDPFAFFAGPLERESTSSAGEAQNSTDNRRDPPPEDATAPQPSSNASSGLPGTTTGKETRPLTPPSQASARSSKSGRTTPMIPNDEGNEIKKNAVNQGGTASGNSNQPKQDEQESPPTDERTTQAISHPGSGPESIATKPTQRTVPGKENSLTSILSTALSTIVNRGLRSVYTPSKKRTIRIPRRYLD